MTKEIEYIIFYYKNYLNKKVKNSNLSINLKDISIKDIEIQEGKSRNELVNLENLSKEYKLYDENYNDYMISMGELALYIEEIEKYLEREDLQNILYKFLEIHNSFEQLEQANIMKDVYVWKFLSKKENKND